MYFDPEPKRRREDFYDYDELLHEFQESVRNYKITLVTGLRRYGKTSLMLTGLNELGVNHIFIDCRLLGDKPTLRGFMELIINEMSKDSTLRGILGRFDFLEVGALGFRLKVKLKVRSALLSIIEGLSNTVLVIDEAQLLRNTNYRFDELLAYIYDHVNVRVVISGSEVGLLYRFLRLNDPESPLYGRSIHEIRIKPLPRGKSMEFLRRGFEQVNVKVNDDVIERAVNELDGVIGWLTMFGYEYTRRGKSLEEIIHEATLLAASEVNKALEIHGAARARFVAVLESVAMGSSTWGSIKRYVNARLGSINDTALSNVIKSLMDMGLISKVNGGYVINDPMVKRAVSNGLIKP
ncbi:AAA family ATPase [Caldivirga maquilingensis]|uniref:ATPase n=1 Tax=Caldivirga maquilingensis (strain ATCC 700844 / DSM 13496 / JCM 10307 / IC-167) TaxID=397948 RepID=A8M991_CALMQ|nr:ATP-binding protein [Caldivirga maquilingensis]ABW02310.1 ATPase [Caldivirga maquilingensis IC-167]